MLSATVFYSNYLDMLQVNSRLTIIQFSMISFQNQFSVLTAPLVSLLQVITVVLPITCVFCIYLIYHPSPALAGLPIPYPISWPFHVYLAKISLVVLVTFLLPIKPHHSWSPQPTCP